MLACKTDYPRQSVQKFLQLTSNWRRTQQSTIMPSELPIWASGGDECENCHLSSKSNVLGVFSILFRDSAECAKGTMCGYSVFTPLPSQHPTVLCHTFGPNSWRENSALLSLRTCPATEGGSCYLRHNPPSQRPTPIRAAELCALHPRSSFSCGTQMDNEWNNYHVLSSDSDDDDVPLNQTAAFQPQLRGRQSGSASVEPDWVQERTPEKSEPETAHHGATTSNGDPDWVRSFTPAKLELQTQESDSDSFINLISGDEMAATQDGASASGDVGAAAKKPVKKKARGVVRPRNELPLVAAARMDESLSLLQAENDELDLSGDIGAVGRVKVQGEDLVLDIKGTLYRAIPYPTNSMCVVSVGEDEAKITAVMNHAVMLQAERNLFAADEGVLDGHVFEDDLGDSIQIDPEAEGRGPEKKKNGKDSKGGAGKKGKAGAAAGRGSKKTIAKKKTKGKGSKASNPKKK